MGLQAIEDSEVATGLTLEQSVIEGYGLKGIERVGKRSLSIADDKFTYGRFTLTRTQLAIPEDATAEEWMEIGNILLRMQGAIQWHLGDWLAYGEDHQWGETYQEVAAKYEYEVGTLWTYASIARAINPLIRNQGLSFSHHRLVAKMAPDEQKYWLERAAAERWSLAQMKEAISQVSQKPPALSASEDRSLLFSPEIPRNVKKMLALGLKVGQGDRTVGKKLLSQIEEHRRWLDDFERAVREAIEKPL
jgi:hypothetical protein